MTQQTADKNEVARSASAALANREPDTVLRPPVDIYEDAEGITLMADVPGVGKDGLSLQIDNDSLTVEGRADFDRRDGMEALYADVRSTLYRRSFALSSELDVESVDASLAHGVLRVRIPKRAEVRPRRIDVRVS